MERFLFWFLLALPLVWLLGARPAYAPLVTVQEKGPAKQAPPRAEVSEETEDEDTEASGAVDLSDLPEAENQPTWSPSFENQNK